MAIPNVPENFVIHEETQETLLQFLAGLQEMTTFVTQLWEHVCWPPPEDTAILPVAQLLQARQQARDQLRENSGGLSLVGTDLWLYCGLAASLGIDDQTLWQTASPQPEWSEASWIHQIHTWAEQGHLWPEIPQALSDLCMRGNPDDER